MKVTFIKDTSSSGWWWVVGSVSEYGGGVLPYKGYAVTKWGAIWKAKRYIKRNKNGVKTFEKELG